MGNKNYQICSRCIMDTTDPNIIFDDKGECDYCSNYENNILPTWKKGSSSEYFLSQIASKKKDAS